MVYTQGTATTFSNLLYHHVYCTNSQVHYSKQFNSLNCRNPLPNINRLENGDALRVGDRHVGSTVTFRCHNGYDLQGPSKVTCQPNGQWTGLSTCNRRGMYRALSGVNQ